MEDNQLKLLEQRINNAVTFIEKLKSREKALQDEKERIEQRALSLQRIIEEKDLKIKALRENQLFLKDKIETILDKLEGLASLESAAGNEPGPDRYEQEGSGDAEAAPGDRSFSEPAAQEAEKQEDSESESIIVEENLVDLKEGSSSEQGGNQEEPEENTARKKGRDEGDRGNDLFDNPFIEM